MAIIFARDAQNKRVEWPPKNKLLLTSKWSQQAQLHTINTFTFTFTIKIFLQFTLMQSVAICVFTDCSQLADWLAYLLAIIAQTNVGLGKIYPHLLLYGTSNGDCCWTKSFAGHSEVQLLTLKWTENWKEASYKSVQELICISSDKFAQICVGGIASLGQLKYCPSLFCCCAQPTTIVFKISMEIKNAIS